ncbi:hypothetical protein C8J57DRAFT_1221774 [Mycena rebaudengoi]|nr:hypothetical protein C8J57DRAFT_1221774 [Mycena rebaudengoi]
MSLKLFIPLSVILIIFAWPRADQSWADRMRARIPRARQNARRLAEEILPSSVDDMILKYVNVVSNSADVFMLTLGCILYTQTQACSRQPALDIPTALQISQNHIWNVVEAMGFPGEKVFLPVEDRLSLGKPSPPIPPKDRDSKRFFRLLMEFLGKGGLLDEQMNSALLIPGSLGDAGLEGHLGTNQPRQQSATKYRPHELDRTLNSTVQNLIRRAVEHHEQILYSATNILPLADTTTAVGSQLLRRIESEISRTTEILLRLPITDAPVLSFLRRSPNRAAQFSAYLGFLEKELPSLRRMSQSASVIRDNLKDLILYCTWYSKYTRGLSLHETLAQRDSSTIQDLTRDIKNLLNRAEIAQMAGNTADVPVWPPRRLPLKILLCIRT